MKLNGTQLAAQLARPLLPVYVVCGDAPLLVIEAADAIRAAARARGHDDRERLVALANFDWGQLQQAAASLSLFGGKKLIDLQLPSGKPGRDGGAALAAYAARPAEDTVLLLTLPELQWKDEKAAWLTALTQAGAQVRCDAPPLAQLPQWIGQRLAAQGQRAEAEGLAFIAARVEGNLLAAQQEVRKLGLLHPAGDLSLAMIEAAVLDVARFDLDGLREALLNGDAVRLNRTLEGLRAAGEAPPLVLWAVTEEIRALATCQQMLADGRSPDEALRQAGVWGPRALSVRRALERSPWSRDARLAQAALLQAGQIDRMIKGLASGDVWDSLLRLGLRLQG